MFKPSLLVTALGAAFGLATVCAQAQNSDRVSVAIGHKAGAAAAVRAEVSKAGGRVLHDMSAADAMVVELPAKAVAALSNHKQVDFVDPGAPRRILGGKSTRGVAAAGSQTVPYGIPMVQADQVSDAAAGNRNLCIVDSGIDGTHEDLAGVPMTGENFTKSGSWNTDENSHGTHVAGTIAALNNAVGVIGVAPSGKLRLHIAKVFDAAGSASSVVIARAMLSCWQAGSNVISMSLGGGISPIEQRVSALLAKKGLLLIAAAGNDGDNTVSYPAGFAEVVSVAAIDASKAKAGFSQFNADVELAAPGVAVQSTVPAFSQTGTSLDVGGDAVPAISMEGSPRVAGAGALANFGLGDTATPGGMSGKVCLISRGAISFAQKVVNCQASGGAGAVIYNNVAGELNGTLGETVTTIPSVGITQADGQALLGKLGQATNVAVFGLPDLYAAYSGTSMATPHASAVAALVWSLHTGCSAEQIRASLAKSAMDLGAAGRDVEFGFGLVQAKAAHNRINAHGCGG